MSHHSHTYPQALDALAFTCLHGSRDQQLMAASSAREMLAASGQPVRRMRRHYFEVSVRAAGNLHCWTSLAYSSIDALLDAMERFDGQQIAITIKPRGRK